MIFDHGTKLFSFEQAFLRHLRIFLIIPVNQNISYPFPTLTPLSVETSLCNTPRVHDDTLHILDVVLYIKNVPFEHL